MGVEFYYHNELFKLGILVSFSIILSFILIYASYLFSTAAPDVEKVSAYECGFDPYEDARNVFDVRFYLVAILFIIFDLEAVFFYPWCISLSFLNSEGYWGMIDFIVELLVGYYYAREVGALEWD
jgi:NADH-quinone oxidoreductase subunit A